MGCEIFNDKLLQDAKISAATIDTSFITNLTESYDSAKSGIWQPLVITSTETDIDHRELLSSAGDDLTPIFNPCACNNNIFSQGTGILDIYNAQDFSSTPNIEIDSSYCTTCKDPSKIDSACQVRSQKDDYIPKIPYLYQGYISGFYDFKNMKQFPSCSNVGLGKEKFIQMDLNSFEGIKLNIDLKLQETITEIPYDPYSTRHETEYVHYKSYKKSRMKSQTCGSFLSITGNMPFSITQPYGFTKNTYNNVYIGSSKVASHWKWNYQSGILGWYRHYDIERETDNRPIPGMDLYIPPGDMFFATPDGPEYSNVSDANGCPSGLKVVQNNKIASIITNDQKFFYISANLYDKFLSSEEKIAETSVDLTPQQIREKALLLTTHPSYDGFTANLHSVNVDEDRNDLGQLTELNQMMTSGTQFASAFGLYYCDTKEILIKTLAHKYGAYIFIEPDSSKTLKPASLSTSSYSIELDFDMVIPKNKVSFSRANGSMLPDAPNYIRNFAYEQEFTMAGQTIVKTSNNSIRGFDETCSSSEDEGIIYTERNHGNYASLYFYGKTVASHVNNSGSYFLKNEYANDQADLIRAYPATAFNPHVDVVAMHKQGGIYANSLPFNLKQSTFFIQDANPPTEGELGIKFTTQDCGIKIYDIKIKKLQTNLEDSKECERFPYSTENACQCFGFAGGDGSHQFYNNSYAKTIRNYKKYIPNLSTNNSPTLDRYGGYDQTYLNTLFGAGVWTAGGKITQLSYKINPLFPYGEEKQDSITLPNYVNTYWNIKLKNLASNGSNHSDTMVSVSENVSLTANRFTGDPEDRNDNMSWKKFTTKVSINSKNIYDQQTAGISVSDNTNITVKLQNPFLTRLINDESAVFAPPDNSENLFSSSPTVYSTRGDESSAVTLTFTRKPRKQLLNFWIPPPTSYGSLTRGGYDPNKGLKSGISTNNPFKEDKPYYDHTFDGDPDWDTNRGILYGPLDAALTSLASRVGEFEAARKLRLYAKIGSTWYVIGTHKRNSYVVNNKLYIGRPKLFEYLKNMKYSQSIPMFFPLSPKKLISWNAFLNHSEPMKKNNDGEFIAAIKDSELQSTYPFLNGKDIIPPRDGGRSTTTLLYPGTRYYFMVDEEIELVKPMGIFEEENDDGDMESVEKEVTSMKDISKITSTYPPGTVVSFDGLDGNKFYYVGGSRTEAKNYFYIGDMYKDLLKIENNLDIRYDENTLHGYVYNSKKTCKHKIKIFQNNKGIISPKSAEIVQKELVVESLDIDGKPTLRNIAKYNIYTKFTLKQPEVIEKLFSIDIANYNNSTSLCVYLNQNSTDTSEYLYQEKSFEARDGLPLKGSEFTEDELQKLNWFLLTKWSDVIKYNHNDPVSDLILNVSKKIEDIYPSTIYNNWFYKQIVNSFSKQDRFKITNRTTDQSKVLESEDVLYCILQKYNVNKNTESIDLNNYRDYHNFIPMMDITIMNQSLGTFFAEKDRQFLTSYGSPVHATIQSPNWTYEHDDYKEDGFLDPGTQEKEDSDIVKRFWVNIEENDLIEAAYVPAGAGAYSETLRLDDPLFWLDSTIKTTTKSTQGVRTTFIPTSNTLPSAGLTIPGFGHTKKTRDYAFSIHNIYGDGDDDGECGAQGATDCFISTRGSVSLKAKLKLAITPSIKSVVSDASEFFFTYDGGTYNAFGQKNLIQIWRSELEQDNPLDSGFDHCSTDYIRPDYKRTFIDPERTAVLKKGTTIVHTEDVKNLDKYANEMLFRILYGENDKVNKNILNSKKKPLTADALLTFTDPKITAADVYDEILYNYDTNTSCNCIQGSFSVRGPKTNGTNYNFNVASQYISFYITENQGELTTTGTIGSQSFTIILGSTVSVKTGVAITDVDTDLSSTENTTYTLRTTSQPNTSKWFSPASARVYTGTCGYGARVVADCQWKHCHGTPEYVWNRGLGQYGQDLDVSTVAIVNCAGKGLNHGCGGNATPTFASCDSPATSSSPPCRDRTCEDYQIGYCRRKAGCSGGECDGEEDMENFLYSFEQCRTTFHVYGHKYKILGVNDGGEEEAPTSNTPCWNITNANVLMDNYPYNGVADQYNWGAGTAGYMRGNAGWTTGNGYGGGNIGFQFACSAGDLAMFDEYGPSFEEFNDARMAGNSPDSMDSPDNTADFGYWTNALIYCTYQARQCADTTDSPMTGDPGYDVCGFYKPTFTIPGRKYYTYRQVTQLPSSVINCPQNICTISYNKNSVTISIGGQTFCEELTSPLTRCPEMSATLPAHSYIYNENINNNCDDANAGQVTLESQKQNYQTLRYTHKQYLGGISGGDANSMGIISTGNGNKCGLFSSAIPSVISHSRAICGSSGGPWLTTSGPTESQGSFGMALAAWKERMINAFNNLNQELGATIGAYPRVNAGVDGVRTVRNSCNANTHIPAGDIVQGMVPGTCSELKFENKSITEGKARAAAPTDSRGGEPEFGTWTSNTVKAYITYDYIRPVTIQDKLKGYGGGEFACAQEGTTGNASDPYPEWYARSLGLQTTDTLGYPIQNYGGTNNYIRRKQYVQKLSYCGDSLTSYGPEDYNKGGDDNYPFGGAPCGRNNYVCWSENRDWINVWN